MDTHERLRQLLAERGWSVYRLAVNCGLSESTLANIFKRNTVPSVTTLEAICNGFGITLSQFFSENEMVELTPELKELFDNWVNLTTEQKSAIKQLLKSIHNNKNEQP
ncbi:MAG: helix-turn-helix domain-containing protein [Ruminococcus sp.]|nr:helix-turn-helix domain-containing protein [Ruminococcus sp.]